jgi:transposase
MIGSTRQVRVWAYTSPCDMRKGYDGLYALVQQKLQGDPLSGDLYLFASRNRKRAKVLMWDGTGLCVYAKRLEGRRFACLWRDTSSVLAMTMSELQLFLEGSPLVGRVSLSPPVFVHKSLASYVRS